MSLLKPLFERLSMIMCPICAKKWYVLTNGVLYWQANDMTRLIVHTCCHHVVLHLAHTVHMGQQKTYAHIHGFTGPHYILMYRHFAQHAPSVKRPVLCPSGSELPCNLSLLSLLLQTQSLWTIVGPLVHYPDKGKPNRLTTLTY